MINKQFDTNFEEPQIKYRVNKLLQMTCGKTEEDAYLFVQLALEQEKNGAKFWVELDEEQRLKRCLFISPEMLSYAQYFLDIVIVDSTYKRNRFNMVLVNILGINNYGKNVMLAFGLINDETTLTYNWIFNKLKKAWRRDPFNFVSDECASILNGIKNNFNSRQIVCGWHIQKNLISHFSSLSKKDRSLYQRTISLPFVTNEVKYQKILSDIQNSQDVSDTQKEYIKKKQRQIISGLNAY